MSPLLSRSSHPSSLSSTPWAKTERRSEARWGFIDKSSIRKVSCWLLLFLLRENRHILNPAILNATDWRPVQACEITHSYVNNKRTNWQNCRLDFSAKWPADKTKVSLQVQCSSDNAAHGFKLRHKINRPTMSCAESIYVILIEPPLEVHTQKNSTPSSSSHLWTLKHS